MREENIGPSVFCGAREVFIPRDKGLRFPPVWGIHLPAESHQRSWRTGEQSKRVGFSWGKRRPTGTAFTKTLERQTLGWANCGHHASKQIKAGNQKVRFPGGT